MFLEFPAVMLFFGLVCGSIGNSYQQDSLTWFWRGTLLGPFGFMWLLVKIPGFACSEAVLTEPETMSEWRS